MSPEILDENENLSGYQEVVERVKEEESAARGDEAAAEAVGLEAERVAAAGKEGGLV